MTTKPLLIFFDNFEKAYFTVLTFALFCSEWAFLLLYLQHNADYVEGRCFS